MRQILSIGAFVVCEMAPLAADEAQWRPTLGGLVESEKAGFGGLCGMCVDRVTGDVVINLSDRGFYRSTDGAKTFRRISDAQPRGRTETPGCFLIDPAGKSKTMLSALVYGAPVSLSGDGATWKAMSEKSTHVDWCALDWSDPERKFVMALKHESGGALIVSHDGGRSFDEIGHGFGPGFVFDSTTAVVASTRGKDRPKTGLWRTQDGGKTWRGCATSIPVGRNSAQALPRWRVVLASGMRADLHKRQGRNLGRPLVDQGRPLRSDFRRLEGAFVRPDRTRRH